MCTSSRAFLGGVHSNHRQTQVRASGASDQAPVLRNTVEAHFVNFACAQGHPHSLSPPTAAFPPFLVTKSIPNDFQTASRQRKSTIFRAPDLSFR
eukprot:3482098-Amphidinium_carterae.3